MTETNTGDPGDLASRLAKLEAEGYGETMEADRVRLAIAVRKEAEPLLLAIEQMCAAAEQVRVRVGLALNGRIR